MSTPAAKPMRQQLDELDALLQRMLSLPINQLEPEASAPPAPPPPAPAPTPPPPPPPPMPTPPPVVASAPPVTPPPPVTSAPPAAPQPMMPAAVYVSAPPAAMPTPAPTPRPSAPSPAPAPTPPAIQLRRAEPPRGEHLWNVPLPPGTGGASFTGFPVGIEALNASATSSIIPRQAPPLPPPPAPPPPPPLPQPGRLNVTMIPSPEEPNRPPQGPVNVREPEPEPVSIPIPTPAMMQPPEPLPATSFEAPLPFYLWPLGLLDSAIGGTLAAFGPPGRWLGQGGGKILMGWAGLLMIVVAAAWGVMDYLGWSW